MITLDDLLAEIKSIASDWIVQDKIALGELTLQVKPECLLNICTLLRDDPRFDFKMLVDVCGVDYLRYGIADWQTSSATSSGFSRGVERNIDHAAHTPQERFAVVYHFLSLNKNQRIRLKVMIPDESVMVDSLMDLFPSANWFEREAFDLFGIIFKGHPDLRRLLTDYGFPGHPFRKDFPLIGEVEVRYDAELRRVVYEPVSIEPRTLEPKVIRHDNRYDVEKPS
ncbi:MAG: NADH-quinone oxidoreductase subunit C [Gammaproteobacteria bacterium RIFCSPHIGHO2_12_FULL_38_14]|nr:MAG: NADH-quinone oxidoreductase subunit C [Gammaproteobacteria bacterium RIFCSPHIGHO2_12_FULL_38_14]